MGSQSLILHSRGAHPEEVPHSAGQGTALFLKMPPSPKQIKVEFKVKAFLFQIPRTTQLQRVFTPRGRSVCGEDVEINTPKLNRDHLPLPLIHPKDNCSRSPEATPSKTPKCVGWEKRARQGQEGRQGREEQEPPHLQPQPALDWRQQDAECVLWWATKVTNLDANTEHYFNTILM